MQAPLPDYQEIEPTIAEVERYKGLTLLEFGAPWCGHCRAASPILQEVLNGLELSHIRIYDGKGKPLGRFFKVKLWPTFILLVNGVETARIVRPSTSHDFRTLLAKAAE